MNELERLAGELTEILGESGIYYEHKCVIEQAAAILLAASKVDVAELMELNRQAAHAYYNWNAGVDDSPDGGFAELEKRKQALETALRMALAQRKWAGLTDAEIHNLDLLPHQMHDQERIDYAKSIEAKLKEKNHG